MPKRLSVDWEKVQADYENNGISYDNLAKKYKIAKSTISNRAHRHNWSQMRHSRAHAKVSLAPVSDEPSTKAPLRAPKAQTATKVKDVYEGELEKLSRKWKRFRDKDKRNLQESMALGKELKKLISTTIAEAENSENGVGIRELSTLSKIFNEIVTAEVRLSNRHESVWAEEIETIRTQQQNNESITEIGLDAVEELFVVNE